MTVKVIFFDIGDTLVSKKQWLANAKETIAALRQMDIRLGLISNTGDLTRDQLAALLPADFSFATFEEGLVMLSSEVGIEKPKLGMFSLAVHNANVPPHETMFVGENLVECLAAQSAGMMAARISNDADDFQTLQNRMKSKTSYVSAIRSHGNLTAR